MCDKLTHLSTTRRVARK